MRPTRGWWQAKVAPTGSMRSAWQRPRLTQRLTFLYVVGLAAIAGLAIFGAITHQASVSQQSRDAEVVSRATEHAVLSPRISESALVATVAGDATTRARWAADVSALIGTLVEGQRALQAGTEAGGLGAASGETLTELDGALLTLVAAADPLTSVSGVEWQAADAELVIQAEAQYRGLAETFLAQYEQEAGERTAAAGRRTLAILGALLALVAAEGLFLFRPATRQIESRAQAVAEAREGEFESLIRHSPDVITIVDSRRVVRYLSPSGSRLWGYSADQLIGTDFLAIIHPEDRARAAQFLDEAAAGRATARSIEFRVERASGDWRYIEATASQPPTGSPAVVVLNSRDVSERKILESKLGHQALHDALTGLPNRALFMERLEAAVSVTSTTGVTVLYLDIDRFKVINDSLGHTAGDALLCEVGTRVLPLLGAGDTLARIGGDEFAILAAVASPEEALTLAESIGSAMAAPIILNRRETHTTVSVGVAVSSTDPTPSRLLREADIATYTAKQAGGGACVLYDDQLDAFTIERLQLETDLRRAIDREELSVHYQPVVDVLNEEIVGMEALVRWQHADQGMVPAEEFIGIAEETGEIRRIGMWVLREACRQFVEWHHTIASPTPRYLSVNLSARQLSQADLVELVSGALQESGLPPALLELEITESVLMQDLAGSIHTLEQLRGLGVRLAIDDFGTGYSSLNYLRHLPVDTLKIDRSFIQEVERDPRTHAILRAIVSMAEALDLAVTAEGVETAAQLQRVREVGCERIQGFYYSPAVDADRMTTLLQQGLGTGSDWEPRRAA